jgi:hypothetical protein
MNRIALIGAIAGLLVLCIPGVASLGWTQGTGGGDSPAGVAEIAADGEGATGAKANEIYERAFIVGTRRAAIGGYAEANMNYAGEEGVVEGPGFEFRRFNLFVYSAIGPQMRFLSELEFEHGTEEIVLETALLDIEIVDEFVLRGGILLTPIGAFNQDHDSPNWDFVDRPVVSTTIIPSTFSEVGVGAHGTLLAGPVDVDYQIYLTQGLADGVLDNGEGRTSIPHGRSEELFEEDNNAEPAITGRVAVRYATLVEVGLSGWHGAYNTYELEGEEVDDRRTLSIFALDFAVLSKWCALRGEAAYAKIDVPASLESTFGSEQWGMHVDAVVPVWRVAALGFDDATLNVGARFEYVDYHLGVLPSTETDAGSEQTRIVGALSFRPGPDTVLRLNYGYQWTTDLPDNPAARGASLQLGLATYF